MPLYEFECERDGRFELLLAMTEYSREMAECPTCGEIGHRVAELVSMRPDSAWHFGQYVHGHGYLNSTAQIKRAKRDAGIETIGNQKDAEAMKKIAADARKDWDRQLTERTHRHFAETFTGTGVVDSFGEMTPEASRKLSDEPITSGNDARVV